LGNQAPGGHRMYGEEKGGYPGGFGEGGAQGKRLGDRAERQKEFTGEW